MNDELYHFGIPGQKWGVRRFQNEDGTLTSEGKERYNTRQDRIKSNNNKIVKYNREQKKTENELKNLERYGVRSKAFKEHVSEHDDYNRETGEPNANNKKVYYVDSQPDDTFSTKEEALAYLKNDLISDVDSGKKRVERLIRENDILMNAPLDSRTFLENESIGRQAALAVGLGAASAATVGIGLAAGVVPAILSLPIAGVIGILASIPAENAVENLGVKKEYRRE